MKHGIKKTKNKIIIGLVSFIVIVLVFFISLIVWYNVSISATRGNEETKIIQIQKGTTIDEIANILKANNLIRSKLAFKIYVRLHNVNNYQAGKYEFNNMMSVEEIINDIIAGNVYEQINITFIEGKTIRWYANIIEQQTNNSAQDVYNLLSNEEYIDSLINKYWFLTEEIKNKDIYYPLEGYLFSETYTFEDRDVSVDTIFETLLNQTDKILSKYREDMQKTGYSIHELITVASIVEMEGANQEDRKNIASVLYNRLDKKMSLGIDSTTYYASKVELGTRNLYQSELNAINPYNTRAVNMEGKLPVGPISSVSEASIQAAIYPNKIEYLYFSSDKDRNIYFSKTFEEHQKIINDLKSQGKWYEF